jgi:hypothetical protein
MISSPSRSHIHLIRGGSTSARFRKLYPLVCEYAFPRSRCGGIPKLFYIDDYVHTSPSMEHVPGHPACSLIGYITAPKLKNTGFPQEICDSEVTQIKHERTTASSRGDTDVRVAASPWKPEMSLQPGLAQPHSLNKNRISQQKKIALPSLDGPHPQRSYFQWTSPSPALGTSIFAKPTFADIELPTLKELEEKRYTELKNIEVEEWRSTCGSSDSGNDSFSGSRPLDPTEGNEIQPVDDAASTRNNKSPRTRRTMISQKQPRVRRGRFGPHCTPSVDCCSNNSTYDFHPIPAPNRERGHKDIQRKCRYVFF